MSKERRQSESKRIDELQRQIEEVAGPVMFGLGDCPSHIAEQFLERVLAFERENQVPLFTRLGEADCALPAPDDLTDQDLEAKLWEVIRALALMGVYLHNTNHLNDRSLYEYLWLDALREPCVLFRRDPDGVMHIDLVDSGSEEDVAIYLRHYADEPTRQEWAREYPDTTLPAHQEPLYDRDRFLPQRDSSGQQGEG